MGMGGVGWRTLGSVMRAGHKRTDTAGFHFQEVPEVAEPQPQDVEGVCRGPGRGPQLGFGGDSPSGSWERSVDSGTCARV